MAEQLSEAALAALRKVHSDNLKSAQIGGQTDGVSPEVAADIGYTELPTEGKDLAEFLGRAAEYRERTASIAQPIPPKKPEARDPQVANYYRHVAAHKTRSSGHMRDPRYLS